MRKGKTDTVRTFPAGSVRIHPFYVSLERRRLWIWALKSLQGWDLPRLLGAGADLLVRKIVADKVRSGQHVPQWVAEAITDTDSDYDHHQTSKMHGAIVPGSGMAK